VSLPAGIRAIACDYDDTLATEGTMEPRTVEALRRFVASDRKIVLVTGRELPDLHRVCPHLSLFTRVVAENGALIRAPATATSRVLGARPPPSFAEELRARGVEPVRTGEVIVATRTVHQAIVRDVIAASSLPLHVILNRGALMVLPAGVDKAAGVRAALEELALAPTEVIGVGDAENDEPLLRACGFGVAVANAVPSLRAVASMITRAERGDGVCELVDAILDR